MELTQEYLKSILYYHPESGDWIWLEKTSNYSYKMKLGIQAGTLVNGYIIIQINNKNYKSHRLAWFYMTGEWPPEQVDHIDELSEHRHHNWWSNLRLANKQQNGANRGLPKNNTSGYKGVCWKKAFQKWVTVIQVNGKKKFLGYFDSKHDAARAYNEAAILYFGEFAVLNEIKI